MVDEETPADSCAGMNVDPGHAVGILADNPWYDRHSQLKKLVRNPVVGDGENPRITENRFARTFRRGVPFIGGLYIIGKKEHDIRNPVQKNPGDVLGSRGALLKTYFAAATEAESAPDLLFEVGGNVIQDGADMKDHAFFAGFGELKVTREKDGPELLHDVDTARPGRELYLAALWTIRME
jgi:hypothetical protein